MALGVSTPSAGIVRLVYVSHRPLYRTAALIFRSAYGPPAPMVRVGP